MPLWGENAWYIAAGTRLLWIIRNTVESSEISKVYCSILVAGISRYNNYTGLFPVCIGAKKLLTNLSAEKLKSTNTDIGHHFVRDMVDDAEECEDMPAETTSIRTDLLGSLGPPLQQ